VKAILYNIEMLTPVIATDLQGDPNSAVSAPFIPGSALRGAIVARHLRQPGRQSFDAAQDHQERDMFLSEATRYLNAYPLSNRDERALPAPAAWRYRKSDDAVAPDGTREIYNLSRTGQPPREVEGAGASFVWLDGTTARLHRGMRQINVHTQRDAKPGRATEAAGEVYRYDAIAAGCRFQAVILTSDELAGAFAALLEGVTLTVGRARRAGYGLAAVTKVETVDMKDWQECLSRGSLTDDSLQITFLSDALLRDSNGHPTLVPQEILEDALQARLELVAKHSFAEGKIIGGFNRKWGLPLPQTTAIGAGSVFVFRTRDAVSESLIAQLEQNGVGERRAEGFGRVAVNWHMAESYQTETAEKGPEIPTSARLTDEEAKLARGIAERLLRQVLDERLREKINLIEMLDPPSNSQLSRLRTLLHDIQTGPGLNDPNNRVRLTKYLDSLETRRSTRRLFVGARIRGDSPSALLGWIKERIDEVKALSYWRVGDGIKLSDEITADLTTVLALEYSLRLIDGVLHRRTKREDR
jgi:CRISPR-associated protein Csx10